MAVKETLATRVTRLENIAIALADSQERTERLLRRQAARTEEQFRKLREEANQREKAADERIARLVSAVGELICRDGRSGKE